MLVRGAWAGEGVRRTHPGVKTVTAASHHLGVTMAQVNTADNEQVKATVKDVVCGYTRN